MERTLEMVMVQVQDLKQCADELLRIRTGMLRHKMELNEAWVSDEIEEINDMIDSLNRRARYIAEELCGVGQDIIKAYEELEEEERLEQKKVV